MKAVFLFLLIFIITTPSLCQSLFTGQPARILKENQVRTLKWKPRTLYATLGFTEFFNKDGIKTGGETTDTSSQIIYAKTDIYLNSSQNPYKEVTVNYIRNDTIAKGKRIMLAVPDTFVTVITYDSLNHTIEKKVEHQGKLIPVVLKSMDGLTEKNYQYSKDSSYMEIDIIYNKDHIEISKKRTWHSLNGQTESTDVKIRNIFDKSGRLKNRQIETERTSFETAHKVSFPSEQEFEYAKGGLMTAMIETTSGKSSYIGFAYEFY